MVFTSTVSPHVKTGLQLLGAWPGVPYAGFSRLVFTLFHLIVQYFQYLYVFAHFNLEELQDLVDCLPTTLNYSMTIIKMMTLWKYQRVVRDIMTSMNTDWRECVNVDQYFYLMTRKTSISRSYSNALFGFYVVAGALYYMTNNANAVMHHQANDVNDTLRPFPIKILFPFEAEQSPVYELLIVLLLLHGIVNLCAVVFVNALLFTLVLHASGQIDIIDEELKTVSEKIFSYRSSRKTLRIFIERHNKVITFCENLDRLFSFMALTQVLLNTTVMCTQGLLVITSVNNEFGADLVKAVFAYSAAIMETFIFCLAGKYLSLKNKSLADAAYNTVWYNMPISQSRSMLFILMRCQKQLTITVGGMTNLSFEAFTSIIKASASYMSVLYAMY